MRDLQRLITESGVLLDVRADDFDSAIAQTLDHCVRSRLVDEAMRATVVDELTRRERESSTAIGHSVSVPHGYFDFLDRQIVVFVRLGKPLPTAGPDGVPIQYMFALLGPKDQAADHLETLMHIARLMSDETFRYDIGEAQDTDAILTAFRSSIERTAPAVVEKRERQELTRTGRLCSAADQDQHARDFVSAVHRSVGAGSRSRGALVRARAPRRARCGRGSKRGERK